MTRISDLFKGMRKGTDAVARTAPTLTEGQKRTLSAIRKYETKVKGRADKIGALIRSGEKPAVDRGEVPQGEGTPKQPHAIQQKLDQLRALVRVPLNLPPAQIEKLKAPGAKVLVRPIPGQDGYEVALVEDATALTVGRTRKVPVVSRPVPAERMPPTGLVVGGSAEQPTIELSIPRSPMSLRSMRTKNQGDVLAQVRSQPVNGGARGDQAEGFQRGLNEMLSAVNPAAGNQVLQLAQRSIDDVAWHDFSSYRYVLEPETQPPLTRLPLSRAVLDLLDDLSDPSIEVSELLGFVGKLNVSIQFGVNLTNVELNQNFDQQSLVRLYQAYEAAVIDSGVLSDLFEIYFSSNRAQAGGVFPDWWTTGIRLSIDNMRSVLQSAWQPGDPTPLVLLGEWVSQVRGNIRFWYPPDIPNAPGTDLSTITGAVAQRLEYPFDLFTPLSWNLGLRLVYRQEWRPLGVQRGEVIRTIPLGPKQVEKVSTKVTRRQKVSRSAESLKAVETTTETTDTTKNSTEVVHETADTHKWNEEEGSGWTALFYGSAGGSGESDTMEEASRRTAAHLTEAVQKTANKLRQEDKVVVSTESESTFELTTASEIQNPNDEIAVTYVYSKVQRQYEVLTRLAAVDGVVYVAESVPPPHEITREWVRRYDWVIAQALLDDSFRDALTSISQDLPQPLLPPDVTQRIATALDGSSTFLNALATQNTSLSLTAVDPSQEAQRAYRETQQGELERRRARDLLVQKQERLFQHIRDNILHYCRAIWSAEDSDQKMLRYRKSGIRIPTQWRFVLDQGGAISGWSVSGLPPSLKGHFEPDLSDPQTVRPLVDVIRPEGAIAYVGNYAVYYLKPDVAIDPEQMDTAFDMLQLMKSAFADPAHPGELEDPALRAMKRAGSPYYVAVPADISADDGREMVDYVPELRSQYEALDEQQRVDFIAKLPRMDGFAQYYYEYRFRKEYSRRLVLDTNNLIVDLVVGNGSALEPFKQLHRYLDVLKAREEEWTMKFENKRRRALLKKDRLGDPDIERVVIVGGDARAVGSLVVGAGEEVADTRSGKPKK